MTQKPIPLPALLRQAQNLADCTAGPGMSTKITGQVAASVMFHLDDLQRRLDQCTKTAAPKATRGRAKELQDEVDQLRFAVRALGEIVEGQKRQARGLSTLDALDTWCRSNGMEDGMPKDLAEATERALGGA